MNLFDAAICFGLLVAVVTGFRTGLLRSALTIIAYIAAMPVAIGMMSGIAPVIGDRAPLQYWPLFFVIFIAAGVTLDKAGRVALNDIIGPEAGTLDRLCGALLGAVRAGLIAITAVLVFDRLTPSGGEPGFLRGSQLRPLLSTIAQLGIRSLPPELTATIDRFKQVLQTRG